MWQYLGDIPWPTDATTECHPFLVSPEWALGVSDPEPPELLLAPVDPEAPPIEESGRKVLRSQALLESMLAGKSVPVSMLVPDPVPGVTQMVRPPVLAYHTGGVCGAPQADFPPSR